MDAFTALIQSIHSVVWGPALMVLLLAAGLWITLRTRAVQFTRLPLVLQTAGRAFRRGPRAEGDVTPFQAMTVAMGGTVGVGNIAGVATAIALGGPGAVFWMWVSGLLGMATKFAEVVLGVHYRRRDPGQPMMGGPMRYIEGGLGRNWKWLAMLFSLFGALAAFGIGNMVQANAVAEGMNHFGVPRWATGLILVVAVGMVTIGGLKRIAAVASVFVPFMVILYMLAGLAVVVMNAGRLPEILALIFRYAFTPMAATGGFAGAGLLVIIRQGLSKGVFSNEAGMGSAPIAHATAMTDHPARQGLWGIFEVFVDTIVVCSTTALVILLTGVWSSGDRGATLTMQGFAATYGARIGFPLVVISMVLTAYDTLLAWGFYGETCMAYLLGHGLLVRKIYRMVWLPFTLLGALGTLEIIWGVADVLNGLMAVPNLIALFALSAVVVRLSHGFFAGQSYAAPPEDK
ncbi:MAG: sodium:alanine symporter family protein [Candidatus Eisenbacteria bacterium]